MATTLSTVDDALAFLQYAPEDFDGEVNFAGELSGFETYIVGEKYHGSIPAALARGLWEFQEEMYRAVAFALYGEDSIRRLTDEQKASFELVFDVSEGSSDIWASLEEFFKKLGEGFTTMDSKDKARTLVAIALIVALAWGGTHVVDTWAEVKQKEIAAASDVRTKEIDVQKTKEQEDAKSKQFEILGQIAKQNASVARFEKATEEGTKAIIKSTSDASHVRVGRVNFSREEIIEVNQRAAKERAEARLLTGDFYVVRVEFRRADSTRIWVATKDYDEFPVTVITGEVEGADIDKLVEAGKDRAAIKLEIEATVIRNQIRGAHIVKVL